MQIKHPPPLGLYIHIPWCEKKCPYCDFNSYAARNELPEKDYVDALLADLAHERLLFAAHDVSEGGSAFALAEMSMAAGVGAEIELSGPPYDFSTRSDSALFAELPGFVFVAHKPEDRNRIAGRVPGSLRFQTVGRTMGRSSNLKVTVAGKVALDLSPAKLLERYETALPDLMSK